jgi:hypothetical protein
MKDLEGSSCVLIYVLFQHFLGVTEEYHENMSEWPRFRLKF